MTNYGISNINLLKPTPGEERTVSVSISSEECETTELTSFPVTIKFNEPVFGFVVTDIVVTNGTKSEFAGSGKTYTVTITPTIAGDVTVDIPANVAHNRVGYKNSAAAQFSIEFVVGG